MCWGNRMSTDKPEKISVVHLLSICIRISELPKLFCLKCYISSLKSDADLVIESVCRPPLSSYKNLHYFSENVLFALVKYRILKALSFFFPGCSLLWIANFESWRKSRVWFLLSVRSLQPLIGRLSKR